MKKLIAIGWCVFLISALGLAGASKEENKSELRDVLKRLKYQEGKINLRDGLATINLSDNFRYLDSDGSAVVLSDLWGNPPSGKSVLGMIVPASFSPFKSNSWCVVIQYEEDGYVKDNDAEKINYTKLLKEMKEETTKDNKERAKEGYPTVDLVGWAAPPRYDKETHKMYWAKELKFKDEGENTLNYNLRILGRRGVLVLNAVSSMGQLQDIETATPDILSMVEFNSGNRYADFKAGSDKVAAYGLAALVAGGVAAKVGLFKGLLLALIALKKFLIIGVIALVAFIKKFFFGRKTES
jgi:uncharacterized membrane-anchored protein